MESYAFGAAAWGALWLGLLTSISPCPMATNVAAMTFIGRKVGHTRLVVLTGLAYTLGRMLTYVVLGVILVAGLLSVPQLSSTLQGGFARLLGPLLILVGMLLLGLINVNLGGSGSRWVEAIRHRAESWGVLGAGLLGVIFALSFCPISAALFFGSLIPLALQASSPIALPSLYGVGTAMPAFAFAVLIAVSTQWVGRAFQAITKFEWWARRLTGVLFLGLGIFETLRSVYGII